MPLQVPPPILGYRHHPLEYFLTFDGFMYNEPQVSFSNHISIASFQAACHLFMPRACQSSLLCLHCTCTCLDLQGFQDPCASTDLPHFDAEHSPVLPRVAVPGLLVQQGVAIKDTLHMSYHCMIYFVMTLWQVSNTYPLTDVVTIKRLSFLQGFRYMQS